MFACSEWVGANQTGPTLMKLTTICDVSHVISYTRPSSPLFFSGGIERKAWERGYSATAKVPPTSCRIPEDRAPGRQDHWADPRVQMSRFGGDEPHSKSPWTHPACDAERCVPGQ